MGRGRLAVAAIAAMPLVACEGILSPAPDRGGPFADSSVADALVGDRTVPGSEGRHPDAAPFTCSLPPASPALDLRHWLHPAAPLAGQTVTLVLQSQNTKPPEAPKLVTDLVNRRGQRSVSSFELAGGAKATYHISVADLAEGENCLVVRDGTRVELAIKLAAPAPTPLPRGSGPWKVTRNHQWTCGEQPTWGNLLRVKVVDEKGAPVSGARVAIRWTDDTVYPVKPDEIATSWEAHAHPKSLTTDGSGEAALMTPWGEGIRTPIDAKPSYLVFLLSVEGGASDVATEITTGLWEANMAGCNYCSTFAVNVYGHWSYTVEFRRDPAAGQVCEVPIDHQGQQKCAFNHFFHEPGKTSCRPVAP